MGDRRASSDSCRRRRSSRRAPRPPPASGGPGRGRRGRRGGRGRRCGCGMGCATSAISAMRASEARPVGGKAAGAVLLGEAEDEGGGRGRRGRRRRPRRSRRRPCGRGVSRRSSCGAAAPGRRPASRRRAPSHAFGVSGGCVRGAHRASTVRHQLDIRRWLAERVPAASSGTDDPGFVIPPARMRQPNTCPRHAGHR